MRLLLFLALAACASMTACQRNMKMDFDWKFKRVEPSPIPCASTNAFPVNMDHQNCIGLFSAPDSAQDNATACERACCASPGCMQWQYCPGNTTCGARSCWIGSSFLCLPENGWISRVRRDSTSPSDMVCTSPECKPGFDDSGWLSIDVPHDFVVNGTFVNSGDVLHGYLPKGAAWYRKHFTLPKSAMGKYIWIEFDGVYRNSKTWLNGFPLGQHTSGYTSFYYEISNSTINWGGDNVLSVYVDSVVNEGWWYEGGGIYRHVWMNIMDPVHIAQWGVYVKSIPVGSIVNLGGSRGQIADSGSVSAEIEVYNSGKTPRAVHILSEVFDMSGKRMASTNSTQAFPPGNTKVTHSLMFKNVSLWSDKSPTLYKLVTTLSVNNIVIDTEMTRFGVRTVVFDVNSGLLLNGQPVKIKGVCNHQDFAGVGVAVPDSVNKFRVQKLIEMGTNGWRMSHNPPNPEILDFTDELGMLVWDENRHFDNYSQFYTDMADMVRRDRNHPSVIMWSVCNEVGCWENNPLGEELGNSYKQLIHEYDTTRPMTAAMDRFWGIGLSYALDVQGINYNYQEYEPYHKDHFVQPMIGSETASCTCARGIYERNDTAAHVDIFSCDACAQTWWTAVISHDYIAGGFIWTGFDYKGEPTPYGWPDINSNFGVFDIAGFPKDTFYYYQSQWTSENVLHLFPHWNWEGHEGKNIVMWAYTNAAQVELFLNGKSQGKKMTPPLGHIEWNVTYQAGTVQAVGYDKSGVAVSKDAVQTAGPAAAVVLEVEYGSQLAADGQDTALIKATIVDSKGLIVPTANNFITFDVSGEGRIIGVGNGDPSCHEPDRASSRSAFNGLARVLVQSSRKSGQIVLMASSKNLNSGKVVISTRVPQ